MRTASEMMMHCSSTVVNMVADGAEMSVLDRQKARLKWQQLDQHEEEEEVLVVQSCQQNFLNEAQLNLLSQRQFPNAFSEGNAGSALVPMPEFSARPVKMDPGLDNGWPDFTNSFLPPAVFSVDPTTPAESYAAAISRTSSCPPLEGNAAVEAASDEKSGRPALPKAPSPSKKRKAITNTKVIPMEEYKDKRVKGETQETEAKHDENNPKREASVDTSKDNSKVSEVQQKPDYIHVRARRGQATDSHSLAERVRREKISERMNYLQDLVPGCNKITGKAGMLDEIINYVQGLQRQVEFLSMKLATVNPRLDFHIDDFFAKEIFPATGNPYPTLTMLPDLSDQAFLQYNQPQPVVTCDGPNLTVNMSEMALRRTTSAPVSAMDSFIDTCFHGQASSSTPWDIDLQTLYNTELHQGRQSAFPSQQYQGNSENNNLKMEYHTESSE